MTFLSERIRHLEEEIERIRRLHRALLKETPEAQEAPSLWTYEEGAFCWRVILRNTLEPDIAVEIQDDLVVVWARRETDGQQLLVGVLPVPAEFDPTRATVRFEAETLVVSVRQSAAGEARR